MKEGAGNDQALREAQLFRTCLHLRRQQRRQLLVNAMRTANAKDASEADLIFAEDRVDFNLNQLARLTKQPDSTSCGWDAHSWAAKAQRSQELLASRRKLHQEFDDQWSQAQLALNRLRALISLATRASADGNVAPRCQELIAVLQGCEVTLLKGMSTHEMSERSMADANTDGSSVFLESVLPKLLTSAEEDLSSDKDFGDDRNAEEEVRLRLMLQDLTNHNEALRREMQELNKQGESSSQGSKGTSEATSATDCDSSEVEASMLHEIAEMRLALMEAYQELARWQQEDPQASAVIAQHQGLYYKSTAGRRGRFAA